MANRNEEESLKPSKVDLHVHSKYSDRPSEWLLRRIGAPESFVEPLKLYRAAKSAGMDFVTISDHNCIRGALEIAHLDDAFVSNEVTTYFPEDRCKVHFLVFGITEEQFEEIQDLRSSIYELRDYVVDEGIAHSVAHPFFRVNRKLTPEHIEKLLVLFNRFEGLNGSRDRRASQLVNLIFRNLSPTWIERAADKHGLEPLGDEPWKKRFTGGSDDHSGLYIASAHTVTPRAASVEALLTHLLRGDHDLAGRAGSSLRLAHSFYHIAYEYYRRRFCASPGGNDLMAEIFEGLIGVRQRRPVSVATKVRGALGRVPWTRKNDPKADLVADLAELVARHEERAGAETGAAAFLDRSDDWKTFDRASTLVHELGYRFVERLVDHVARGRLFDALQSFASLAPVGLGIAPYLASFATQHKDETFLRRVAEHFPAARHHRWKRGGLAWLTDTYGDTNGVAKMIQSLGREAFVSGLPLEVLTCEEGASSEPWRRNFRPVGRFALPEYEAQQQSFPPFLEILEAIEERDYSELLISTPGPMGLVGLAAARLLGLRAVGIYHTDFPAYVGTLTGNQSLASLTGQYMSWFYQQMDGILAPSEAYRRELVSAGLPEERIAVLRRGVDVDHFSPTRRSETFWSRISQQRDAVRVLYVGRLSREKNLDRLLEAFESLPAEPAAELFVVGDGPARDELEARCWGRPMHCTGFLEGEALATAFASADLFVFPSETDTFGNVVLEAQASGLPAIVSTVGGPQEIIEDGRTGVAVDCSEPGGLEEALAALVSDPQRRREMSHAALIHSRSYRWSEVLAELWAMSPALSGQAVRGVAAPLPALADQPDEALVFSGAA